MMEWKVYRVNKRIKSAGATETIIGEKVPTGFILEVTQMCVMDETTADKLLRLGIRDVTDKDNILQVYDGATAFECHLNGVVFLEAGEAPIGIITTAAASDYCDLSVQGKLYPLS